MKFFCVLFLFGKVSKYMLVLVLIPKCWYRDNTCCVHTNSIATIKEIPQSSSVFVIGVYSGASKPINVQEYLQEFIVDMKAVSYSGIVYNGLHIRVALSYTTCTH